MFQQIIFLLQFSQDFSSFGKMAKIPTDSTCHPSLIAVSQVLGWEPATNKFSQAGRGWTGSQQFKQRMMNWCCCQILRAEDRLATLSTAVLYSSCIAWQFLSLMPCLNLWLSVQPGKPPSTFKTTKANGTSDT